MSRLSLSLAGALHEQGAVIVNPYPVTVALRDRVIKSRVLQLAGVPTPTTYVASTASQLAPPLEEGPLVIKPYQEGGQVKIVRTPAELARVELGRDPVFAQRYHPPQGRDWNIYVIGGQLFGVKKVFPRRTEEEKLGEPFTPPPELSNIARRCGRAFEIDLYGVDVIESDGKAYVVDMDSIAGYEGVPDAPLLLAPYFYDAAERAVEERPPLSGSRRDSGYFH